jgi:hypothetical protein
MIETQKSKNNNDTSENNLKVLFYTNTQRAFRATLIGHLFEICQVYQVVLLSENLDDTTLSIINDKSLFPNLLEIIPLHQYTGSHKSLFHKNRYLYHMCETVINNFKPDIVIASSDWQSLFEMYLMRFAKRANILSVTFQDVCSDEMKNIGLWINLINAYTKMPEYLPLWIRLCIVKLRAYCGHILIYWLLPILNMDIPFLGWESFILYKGHSGTRDSDYHVTLSERDYDISRKNGVPPDKLYILPHPLTRQSKYIFQKLVLSQISNKNNCTQKTVVVLLNEVEIGFTKTNYSLINKEIRVQMEITVFHTLLKILNGWNIIVKPHPMIENYQEKKKRIESISHRIKVVDPNEPIDKYIELADVIVGLPRSTSTALFTASLQCPEKPILSLDLHDEFSGDFYNNYDGIEYVNTINDFVNILANIRDNTYARCTAKREEPHANHFSNTIEIIEYFVKLKHNSPNCQ